MAWKFTIRFRRFYLRPASLIMKTCLKCFKRQKKLGATRVKFAVGEFDSAALGEYHLLVTIEGDHSSANGRIEPILALMDACKANDVPVYSTFDVGNFVWAGQDRFIML